MKTSKWKQSQINILLEKAKDGSVRMHAFEEVAKLTGRKPNSVRNFYYKLISNERPIAGHNKQKFAPFNAADTTRLLREIVLGTSRGESVRGVCLKMSGGNRGRMLRLQNKYRAVIAKKPQRISDIVEMLKEQGYLVKSPLKHSNINSETQGQGAFGKKSFGSSSAENNIIFMPEHNKKLSDADINNLFIGLVRLIKRSAGEEQNISLKQQISGLKAEIEMLKKNSTETGDI